MKLKVAFVAGLTDRQLSRKIEPLRRLVEIERIDLFRRQPFVSEKVRWMRVPNFHGRFIFLQELVRGLRLLAGAYRYDVIIGCHQFYHGIWAWLAAGLWRKPVVQVVISDVDRIGRWGLTRRALLKATAIGVRGPRSKENLKNMGYCGPIEILHNTCDWSWTPAGENKGRRFHLLVVANYRRAKDYPWMFQVLSRVVKERPDLKIGMAGRGQENIQARLSDYELQGHVSLLGERNGKKLTDLYNHSEALILTSKSEGLPMAVVEAMSFGLPVVVSDAGELPWLVRNAIDGYVVPHGDTDRMARAIVDMLANKEKRKTMGIDARKRFEELLPEFQPEKIGMAWKSLLDFCVENRVD